MMCISRCCIYIFITSLITIHATGNVSQNAPMLLYSTKTDIRIISTLKKVKPIIIIRNLTDGAAIDYHYEQKKLCWTDHDHESVQCVTFDAAKGTAKVEEIEVISTGILSPDGLACDWFTNNLYWTDSEANRIEVASMSTRYRKVLFWTKTDQPRAIALDPMQGLMFWTDWGEEPKIERAGMDGDQATRKVIVSQDIFWPNGLTLDFESKRIYWIDGKLLFLKRMDYNGENMLVVIKNGLDYPFALTHFQNKLYWSDWKQWSIYVYDRKLEGKNATREFIHSDVVPMDIHIWDASRQPYKAHPCEHKNGGCSHLCLLSPNQPFYSCACPIGIKLINNLTCADGPQEMLLLATRTEICVIYLDSPDYTREVLNLTNIKYSIAVDYDPVDKYLFWTDTNTKKIQRAKLDGSDQTDIVNLEIESSDGIAIDWVARNIYWTDSGIDRIEVARLDGRRRKVLIYDGLLDPRAIAVAPNLGWIFWSDWNDKNPKIERANMDATERTVIISEELGWVNGIALDLQNLKIYWCDAKQDVIELANMDGTDRRVLVNENLPHPFGFSLLGDFIYWTDWQRRVLHRVNKETGDSPETILEQIPNIMGIKAIRGGSNYSQDFGNNPCGVNNGGCEHFCFYRHNITYICVCQIGYELTKDKRSCKIPEAFLIYTKDTGATRISIENEYNQINLPINGVKNETSIDYHVSNNRIYWSDAKLHAIMRSYINGSDVQKVVELGLTAPEGLAVDWVALNIYWSDPATHKIEVARLDGSSRRVLLWRDSYVEPHSIALDPQNGYMYWTEWAPSGNPAVNAIKKAAMDGSNAKKLVVTTGFATGLTLDFEKARIYWTETNTPAIISSDLNGLNKIFLVKEMISRPVGLALYKDYIYWTDDIDKKGLISAAMKTDGSNRTIIASLKEIPTDLLLVQAKKQDGFFNQCAVDNGGCSHLCLALPVQSPGETMGYTCACPTHYTLQNNTCTPPKRFMIYSQRNLAVRLLPDTSECLEAVLPIQGLKGVKAIDFDPVLQFLYWIGKEGKTLSIKRAKAIGTHTSVVIPGGEHTSPWDLAVDALGRLLFWSCSIQDVINVTRLDNGSTIGVVVQVKGERPRLLALHPTKRLLFYTTDVRDASQPQIVRTRMDGSHKIVIAKKKGVNITAIAVDIEGDVVVWAQGASIHMANIDGENQHEVLKEEKSLRISQLTVHSGWLYWLDRDLKRRELTTGDSSSVVVEREHGMLDLISVTEPDKNHKCAQIHTQRCSHLCIMNGTNALCACPLGLRLEDNKRTCAAQAECGPEYFTCSIQPLGNKDCVPLSWKCDGQMDCQDSSDEVGCPFCRADQFRCHSGECIDTNHRCDDIPHCKDKSDEERCCRAHEFQCPRTDTCIPLISLCDGIEHCADGEDEKKSVCKELKDFMPGMGLPTIVFCIVLAVTSGVIIIIAFYYFKNSVNIGNTVADQSEDPLNPIQSRAQIKALKMRNKGIPDVVHMSMLNGSQSLSYDRDNITGASSSTNSSSVACYPRETLNPPPSPATTAASTRGSSPSSRYRPYKHYRSINQPPPPTPCSTDICDESDYNYPTNRSGRYDDRSRYDAGPFPPPPTPKSHCHTESCPPSPSSRSSTYFSPLPPPPSPVASPPRSYDS